MNLELFVQLCLAGLGVYLACGVVFAVPFVWGGVNHIEPHAKPGSVGFRIVIFPGTVFLWPLLLRRWMRGTRVPPEERNAHRTAGSQHPRES